MSSLYSQLSVLKDDEDFFLNSRTNKTIKELENQINTLSALYANKIANLVKSIWTTYDENTEVKLIKLGALNIPLLHSEFSVLKLDGSFFKKFLDQFLIVGAVKSKSKISLSDIIKDKKITTFAQLEEFLISILDCSYFKKK